MREICHPHHRNMKLQADDRKRFANETQLQFFRVYHDLIREGQNSGNLIRDIVGFGFAIHDFHSFLECLSQTDYEFEQLN